MGRMGDLPNDWSRGSEHNRGWKCVFFEHTCTMCFRGGGGCCNSWLKEAEKRGYKWGLDCSWAGKGENSGLLVEVRLGICSTEMEQLSPGTPLVCDVTRGWAACAGWEWEQVVGWQQGLASELLKSNCFLLEGYQSCVMLLKWMVLK